MPLRRATSTVTALPIWRSESRVSRTTDSLTWAQSSCCTARLTGCRRTATSSSAASSVGRFGSALAAGNFDAAGGDDLAVGAPTGSIGGSEAGDVYTLSGTPKGLRAHPIFVPDGHAAAGAHCGTALASLNWDNDPTGYADLAVGCPNASPNAVDEGAVQDRIWAPPPGSVTSTRPTSLPTRRRETSSAPRSRRPTSDRTAMAAPTTSSWALPCSPSGISPM